MELLYNLRYMSPMKTVLPQFLQVAVPFCANLQLLRENKS